MAKKVILCVDDEKIVLDSLKRQLRTHFGSMYQVEAAENAAEAIELIEELDADQIETLLIVSDWLMPEMKGDEFLIRVHQKFPKIAKVMLTGQADADAIENAKKNANLHHCLTKPWTEEELIRIINSAIA